MKRQSANEQKLQEYVSTNLRQLREGTRLNQTQMSRILLEAHPECGATPKRISDIEANRKYPYAKELMAYAEFFDCTIEALFEKPVKYGMLSMDGIRRGLHRVEQQVADSEDEIKAAQARLEVLEVRINQLQDIVDATPQAVSR
mgnify:CR=1 FL=1